MASFSAHTGLTGAVHLRLLREVDVDPVAHQGKLLLHAISEHVENAGVHSGDATLVLPPFSLTDADMACLKQIVEKVAAAFEISGPFNMQVILFSSRMDRSSMQPPY